MNHLRTLIVELASPTFLPNPFIPEVESEIRDALSPPIFHISQVYIYSFFVSSLSLTNLIIFLMNSSPLEEWTTEIGKNPPQQKTFLVFPLVFFSGMKGETSDYLYGFSFTFPILSYLCTGIARYEFEWGSAINDSSCSNGYESEEIRRMKIFCFGFTSLFFALWDHIFFSILLFFLPFSALLLFRFFFYL